MEDISSARIVVNDIQDRLTAEMAALTAVGFNSNLIVPSDASLDRRINFAAFFIQLRTPHNVFNRSEGIVTGWPERDLQQKTILEAFIMGICDLNPKFPFIIFTEDTYPSYLYRNRRNILVMEFFAVASTGIRMREMLRT